MRIEIPYRIGDTVRVNGRTETVKGVQVYVKQDGTVESVRLHIGRSRFVTIKYSEGLVTR